MTSIPGRRIPSFVFSKFHFSMAPGEMEKWNLENTKLYTNWLSISSQKK